MPVEVVDIHNGYAEAKRHAFGETCPDEERSEQTRSARETDGRQFVLTDAGTFQGCIDNRDYVLLMGARGKFRHHAAKFSMYFLRSYHVAQQHTVADHSRRGVVA